MTSSGDETDPTAPPGTPDRPRPPADTGGPQAPGPDPADPLDSPGGPVAVARGCRCSTLANAAYRAGAQARPLVDPACPLHVGAFP